MATSIGIKGNFRPAVPDIWGPLCFPAKCEIEHGASNARSRRHHAGGRELCAPVRSDRLGEPASDPDLATLAGELDQVGARLDHQPLRARGLAIPTHALDILSGPEVRLHQENVAPAPKASLARRLARFTRKVVVWVVAIFLLPAFILPGVTSGSPS